MNEQDIVIREFLAESYENLDQLERDLVTIEVDPAQSVRRSTASSGRSIRSKGLVDFLPTPSWRRLHMPARAFFAGCVTASWSGGPRSRRRILALSDAMRKIMGHIEENGTEGGEDHTILIDQLMALQGLQDQSSEPAASTAPAEERNWPAESRQSLGICPEAPVTVVPSPRTPLRRS